MLCCGNTYPAYHKIGPALSVFIESVAGDLAHRCGLPVPQSCVTQISGGPAFSTQAMQDGDLLSLIRSDASRASGIVSRWPLLPHVAVFDELIANPDRNKGNLLFDGKGGFLLIDHGHAIHGGPFDNYLMRLISTSHDWKEEAVLYAKTLAKTLPHNIDRATEYSAALIPTKGREVAAVRDFLQWRAKALESLVLARF